MKRESAEEKMARTQRRNKKKKEESVWESFAWCGEYLLDLILCIYMLLIIVVLPFYHQEGYTHIGTDKAMFFRHTAWKCGIAALPVLVCVAVFRLMALRREGGKDFLKKLRAVVKEKWKAEFSPTDYFAAAYGAAVILSYLASEYRQEALWGTTGWYMGAIPQLMLVCSYFFISRAWNGRTWLVLLMFPVSAIVFLLGLCNRFGYYPIDMQVQNVSFISTIGNINWYCGYLVTVFFAGVFLLWKKDWHKLWQQALMICYTAIGFATLVTQGSSSGVVALAVLCLVLFCLSASDGKRMEAFWLEMCLLSVVCLGIYILCRYGILQLNTSEESVRLFTGTPLSMGMMAVSVVCYAGVKLCNRKGCYPQRFVRLLGKVLCALIAAVMLTFVAVLVINTGSGGALLASTPLADNGLFLFSDKWGSSRGATWSTGVRCYAQQNLLHKLLGAGPDCMAAFLSHGAGAQLQESVENIFGGARLTNAHNEWLTMLVNVGLCGAAAYAGMMVSAIYRFLRRRNRHVLIGACGCCLLAYTVNNMFSFQQSMSASTIFILLAVGENYYRRSRKRVGEK